MRYLKYLLPGVFFLTLFFAPEALAHNKNTCSLNDPCGENVVLQEKETKGEICLYFFFAPGCPACKSVEKKVDKLSAKYPIARKQINARSNPQLLQNFLRAYNVPLKYWGKVPIVFVGDQYLVGDKAIEKLEEMLKGLQGKKVSCLRIDKTGFRTTFGHITLLALSDAVNPCALTIFLLLLLTLAEQRRFSGKKVFLYAASFVAAVFLVYLLLGLFITMGFKGVANLNLSFSYWIYKGVGVLAILFGLYNLAEFVRSKGGTCKVQPLFGVRIDSILSRAFSISGMFVAGLLIALFLLPCSSGPYFVAGGLLSSLKIGTVLGWLLYYNFLFVLPFLVIALLISLALIELNKVSGFMAKNQRWFDLLASLLLIGLGIWVIIS